MGSEPIDPDTPDAWTTDANPQLMGVAELLGMAVRLTSVGGAVSEAGVGVGVGVAVGVTVGVGVAVGRGLGLAVGVRVGVGVGVRS